MIKQPRCYPELADPQQRPRYTGVPTFFRTRYAESLDGLDIALVGVPFDGGVTNRSGARHGPRAVRDQSSLLRRVNAATDIDPYALARIADVGDAWIEAPFELTRALDEIQETLTAIHAAGVVPVSVGGDHSVTLPILRAVAKHRPVGMVHVDAHCDTGDDYLGSRFHHGAPFRRAVEEGLLDPKRVIQIGIRGTTNVRDHWKFSTDSGMRVLTMDEFHDRGWRFALDEARRVVGDGPVYVSFDVDGLDPIYAPGTGTPEAGGISMIEAMRLIRGLDGLDVIGGDVVEVAPPFDHAGLTAFHGATILYEILCLAAARVARRRG
ncbi:MAG: agmatinase [Alphaproteobacteria bacterium]|nr:agmatinase [Alphaproteobacteria bacterium]